MWYPAIIFHDKREKPIFKVNGHLACINQYLGEDALNVLFLFNRREVLLNHFASFTAVGKDLQKIIFHVTKNKIAGLHVQKCFWNVPVLEINNSTLIFEVMSSWMKIKSCPVFFAFSQRFMAYTVCVPL